MKKYIVREGDTMWSVSKATGVRLNLLMAANPQITDPKQLRPGQVIVIPELHKGNTHGAIGTPGTPMQKPTPHVPQAAVQPPVHAPAAPPPPQPSVAPANGAPMPGTPAQTISPYFGFVWPHVVKKNETWENIAGQYGVHPSHLKQMNPSHADAPLQEGDILYIPGTHGMQPSAHAGMPGMGPPPALPDGQMPPPTGEMPAGMPYPAPQPVELGPHTHHPYRAPRGHRVPYGYPMPPYGFARPADAVPEIPPGMWAFVPASPYGSPYGRTPYPGMSPMSYYHVPATWYRDLDESSSWDDRWSSSTLQPMRHEGVDDASSGAEPKWFGESRDGAADD